MKGYANPNLLVAPRDLAAMIDGAGAKRPLLLDLRPPEAYAAGHLRTAIHLDLWGVSLIDTDPAPLRAFMWMIEHVLATHGVDAATPIVVYDEQSGIRAARAFWFLEYLRASLGPDAGRRVQRVDRGRPRGHAGRGAAAEERVDRHARGAHDRHVERGAQRARQGGLGDPRHADRG